MNQKELIKKDNLVRFKKLLEYFISHVEYCQRLYLRDKKGQDIDPTTSAGFDEYTAAHVLANGKLDPHEVNEWKPDTINALKNKRIKGQWDTFEGREVRMVVKNHFGGSYASARCFLDHGGWRNINNVWNEDRSRIVALKIRRNIHDSHEKVEWVEAKVTSIKELGLFDGQEPNTALEIFFGAYMNL